MYTKHKKSFLSSVAGFTVLETLVAVLIFSIAVSGMVVVIAGGAQSASFNKYRLTGIYLAEEGIELVRNERDWFFLAAADLPDITTRWNDFLNWSSDASCDSVSGGCAVWYDQGLAEDGDVPPVGVHPYGGAYAALTYDADTGFYGYNGAATKTRYTRRISIIPIGDGNAVRVTATVTYPEAANVRTYETSEVLFNWF